MQIITRKEAKEQGLKRYFTGKPCPHGHIAERRCGDGSCLTCALASSKAWHEANREKELARQKACYAANREEVRARHKAWYAANYGGMVAPRQKAYRANNPQARAANILRTRISDALRASKATKSAQLTELLGASIEEVRAHLEAQFKLGMTWDNWSLEGWHVDHIKPCASFDLTDPEQQKACFHFSNLQPLWAKDNLSKHDRLDWVPVEA